MGCSLCRGTGAQDWVSELTSSLNRMSQDINEQVQHLTQRLHTQIRQNVESSVEPVLKEAQRMIENLPRGKFHIMRDARSLDWSSGPADLPVVGTGRDCDALNAT